MRGPTTAYERLRENAAKVDTVFKFGRNASVGTSAEDIWHSGGLWTGFLTSASAVRIASGGNAGCDIWMLQRQVSDAGPLSSRGIVFYNLVDDTIVQPIQNPLLFPEKTDLWFRGAAASGTSAVSCAYELELYSEAL